MAQAGYTPDEAVQIAGQYRTLIEGLRTLHDAFATELQRAQGLVAAQVRDESFARVLVAAELMRGINKDERQPVSSTSFVLSEPLRDSLRIAYDVGIAVAPFTLRSEQGFLSRWFGKRPPRLAQPAKEAILRIAAAHASSRNRTRTLALAPPASSLGKARPAALLGRR
jgi:hypothetical protein